MIHKIVRWDFISPEQWSDKVVKQTIDRCEWRGWTCETLYGISSVDFIYNGPHVIVLCLRGVELIKLIRINLEILLDSGSQIKRLEA